MSYILALDFGGTRCRAALFDAQMQMVKHTETLTQVEEGQDAVIQRLLDLGQAVMLDDVPLRAIGIAGPGPLDAEDGIIYHARTLPGWQATPISTIVQEAFGGVPAHLQNDANLGALAEYTYGAGREADPMLYLTLSTGIGGAAIIGGQLFTGAGGLALEPGHMRFTLPDGSIHRLEDLASGTALRKWAQHHLKNDNLPSRLRELAYVDGARVGIAALTGDMLAQRVVHDAGRWLGLGLVNLLHLFNPRAIVIGGSVAQLGETLLKPARAVIHEQLLHSGFWHDDLLRVAELGDDVCLYGAALYAQSRYTQNAL